MISTMRTENNTLVNELLAITDACTASAKNFTQLPPDVLNFKEAPERWSILECIEHLNRYGDYYLPEIEKAIMSGKTSNNPLTFSSGVFGNYFANLMKVKNGKMIRMKTPGDKNPVGSQLSPITIDRFIKQQEKLRSLLEQARKVDLTGTKVPISLTKFLKLRAGDTFRFFVYHIERHILQAQKAKESAGQRAVVERQ
jgi:hypothetical protein